MNKFLTIICNIIVTIVVIIFGLVLMAGGVDKLSASMQDVPEEYLIGGCEIENTAIVQGYVDGRKDAISGVEPSPQYLPRAYHYGYRCGYADYSDTGSLVAINMSPERGADGGCCCAD